MPPPSCFAALVLPLQLLCPSFSVLSLWCLRPRQVPALATKDFALRFLAFKEGVTTATVTFTNDDTDEYLFHRLTFTATAPGIQVHMPENKPPLGSRIKSLKTAA